MDKEQVVFQREEDAVSADAQAIPAGLADEFPRVALEVGLQQIEAPSDPSPYFRRQGPQLIPPFGRDDSNRSRAI
jgi:hypothetical protein